jgi:PAS domain S-box-containing protein
MNKKEEYINSNISKLFYQYSNIVYLTSAIIIPLLSVLDYYVTNINFKTFLIYRIIASILFCVIFFLNKLKRSITHQTRMLILGTIIVSVMIELMVLKFGGHQSPYFAGMILTIIYVLGFMPISLNVSVLASSIIYGIYFVPILIFDKVSNLSFFVSINVFIISIISFTLIWKYFSQKGLINELGLQYDLDQEKHKIENYSIHLEDLVQERTKELTVSEERFRALFDNANDGVVVLDRNGIILNMNNKFCGLHGFDKDALIGTNCKLLEVEDNREEREERFKRILNGEATVFDTEHYRKDGSRILLEVSSKGIEIGGELFIQSLHRDITEKKAIQEQLIQSQKMESVGQLAGGVAHNFNNLLTSILGYAELLQEHSNLDSESKRRVNSIESAARKAGVMVSKLLSFSRRESYETLPLTINDAINDSVRLLEGVLDKRIGVKTTLSKNLPTIEGDPNQLEQVIMNLMVNARDAMPDGGLITVHTNHIEIEKERHNMPAYVTPGNYILLSVSDTGNGIPKEIINKIFDPFFTTKEKGKGTGLGLATVYGIIKDHKGYVTVQSEVDKGTTFDIYLPISGKSVYRPVSEKLFSVSGHENILLVDDEEEVLLFIKDILETHGYRVLTASNPLAATDIFKKLYGDIHLVISDIVMPLMQGTELVQNLRTIKPDVKIIAISGYSEETINKEKMMIDEFIRKPFEVYYLLSTVRRVLDTGIRNIPPI